MSSAPTHRPPLPQGKSLVLIFRGWVDPRAHGSVSSYRKKIPSDTTGNRSRDHPTSSAVSKPLRYPRPLLIEVYSIRFHENSSLGYRADRAKTDGQMDATKLIGVFANMSYFCHFSSVLHLLSTDLLVVYFFSHGSTALLGLGPLYGVPRSFSLLTIWRLTSTLVVVPHR
jgi:hypothetical protein